MIEYTRGDAIWVKATFTDVNSALIDPTSTWGYVYDSSSTIVATLTSLSRRSVGVYEGVWQSSRSCASGVAAFEACGLHGGYQYVRREILFKLV